MLGHWGEMLLWMDRADSLSGVAHLERKVSDYITANIHITSSGMLQQRLLRHTLDFTGADRVLFSTDYPFDRPNAAAAERFLDAIADPADRSGLDAQSALHAEVRPRGLNPVFVVTVVDQLIVKGPGSVYLCLYGPYFVPSEPPLTGSVVGSLLSPQSIVILNSHPLVSPLLGPQAKPCV